MRKTGPEVRLCLELYLLDSLWLAALVLLPVLWIFAPLNLQVGTRHIRVAWHIWLFAMPALLLVARFAVKDQALRRNIPGGAWWELGWFRHLSFSLLFTFLFFDALEVTLTRIGFEVKFPEVVFEGKDVHGTLHIADVESDPLLLWRFKPGSYFSGRKINRMGFREREVNPVKPPGTRRVVCLGDSVTAQGRPGYSEYLHRLLSAHPPTSNRWEAFNMGVYGYSAAQGLRLFELTKDRIRPDIMTLYFGWNDHWCNVQTDRQQMALDMRPLAGRIVDTLRNKRFFQLLIWAVDPHEHVAQQTNRNDFKFFHSVKRAENELWDPRVLRVPPREYRSTLTALVREIRAVNAVPLLITAPRRHLSEALVGKDYARSVAEAERWHDEYVAITREVARENHAELLDLARLVSGHDCDAYFQPDGIHFDCCEQEGNMIHDPEKQPGLMRIAEELDKSIRQITRSTAWREKESRDPNE